MCSRLCSLDQRSCKEHYYLAAQQAGNKTMQQQWHLIRWWYLPMTCMDRSRLPKHGQSWSSHAEPQLCCLSTNHLICTDNCTLLWFHGKDRPLSLSNQIRDSHPCWETSKQWRLCPGWWGCTSRIVHLWPMMMTMQMTPNRHWHRISLSCRWDSSWWQTRGHCCCRCSIIRIGPCWIFSYRC